MTGHLTTEQIRAWVAGELAVEAESEVEQHLSECDACAERMASCESPCDGFVDRVRDIFLTEAGDGVALGRSREGEPLASSPRTASSGTASPGAAPSASDQNLAFGMLAMQSAIINTEQFMDACTHWMGQHELDSKQKGVGLDQILLSRGCITPAQFETLHRSVKRRFGTPPQGRDTSNGDRAIDSRDGRSESGGVVTIRPESAKRLRLESVHSTGGIGRVWKARDEVLNREIAFKELLPDRARSKQNRARFFREAQITAQLTHPGVVPVHDYVDEKGQHFYTMRFVKGRTLTEVIEEYHGDTAETEAGYSALLRLLNHFVSICQTIAYAHSKNVIHRDLKGDNVIVGDFGEVIVLDWGLAKRHEKTADPSQQTATGNQYDLFHTVQGERLGTPAFMAPEQAEGRLDLIDFRTDVYGLAAILYELLTGDPPFTSTKISQVLSDVLGTMPVAPHERRADVPPGLEAICMKGLAKKGEDRQQSVEELTRQIEDWIVRQSDHARSVQMRERFFGLSLDLFGVLDIDGKIREANPAWEKVLGWTAKELSETTIWDLVHPEEHETLTANLDRFRQGERLLSTEHRCVCSDRSWKWISWNANYLDEEETVYIVGRDVSHLKE